MMQRRNRVVGFTLVEVLISIFILSLISVAALSSFQQMIRAKEVQRSHEAVLTALSFAYTTMLNDLSQKVDLVSTLSFHERMISFTRASQGGDGEKDTATINYQWENDHLTREMQGGETVASQTLLKNVRNIEWQWIADQSWQDVSVPLSSEQKVRALKLTFIDPVAGEMSWVFMCP